MRNLQFFLLLVLVSLADRFLYGNALGISSSLSHSICEQGEKFTETQEIQAPVKAPSAEALEEPCGWFLIKKEEQSSVISFVDCKVAKTRKYPKINTKKQSKVGKKQGKTVDSDESMEGRTSRIVGGTKATRGEFPSIVSVRVSEEPSCGGTIISPEWVLTAAHCKPHLDVEEYKVVAGEYKLTEEDDPVMQTRDVVEFILHEKYKVDPPVFYDIALVKVSPPFDLNDKIKAVKLPDKALRATGKGTVAGWGLTSDGGTHSDILLKTTLPLMSDATCADKLGDSNVAPNVLCAGLDKGGKDACQGDSGGPLYSIEGGVQTIVGVVSWGSGCAEPDSPGVYTEVAYFIDWIKKTAGV